MEISGDGFRIRCGEAASRRISEKTGMRLIATLERDYVSGRLPAEIWEITADEWRSWKKRPGSAPGI